MLKYKKIFGVFLLTIALIDSTLYYYKPKLFSVKEKFFLHLDNKKILEDFDYLHTALKENSPLVCVAIRNGF
jgi:hypothetical protein